MADCLIHGYSGGPGSCGFCEIERKYDLPRGSEEGYGIFPPKEASNESPYQKRKK